MNELNNRKVIGIELVFENLEYVTINVDAILDIGFDNPHEKIFTSRGEDGTGLVISSTNYVDSLLLMLDINKLKDNIDWTKTRIWEEGIKERRNNQEDKLDEILKHFKVYNDISSFKVLYSDYIGKDYYVPYNGDMENEWQYHKEFKDKTFNILNIIVSESF